MMRLSLKRKIAFRYLISKKSHSVINLISVVSVVAIAVPTAAMVILLSVHNGFERFVEGLWGAFNPPLVVEAAPDRGRYFDVESIDTTLLNRIPNVKDITFYLEDNALFRYKGRQMVGRVRGVDSNYSVVTSLQSIVVQGRYDTSPGNALIGMGVAYTLGLKVNLSDDFSISYPSRKRFSPFNRSSFYSEIKCSAKSVFTLDASSDADLVFVGLDEAWRLYGRRGEVTALGVDIIDGKYGRKTQEAIAKLLGADFVVKDAYEQNIDEYKLVQSEKFAIYMIILLVLLIASFTLIGAVVMLMLEKKRSLTPLRMMGATEVDIKHIFLLQGLYLSSIGAVFGVFIGLIVALVQQYFGVIRIAGDATLIDSYPVFVKGWDVLLIWASVMLLSAILVWLTTRRLMKNNL